MEIWEKCSGESEEEYKFFCMYRESNLSLDEFRRHFKESEIVILTAYLKFNWEERNEDYQTFLKKSAIKYLSKHKKGSEEFFAESSETLTNLNALISSINRKLNERYRDNDADLDELLKTAASLLKVLPQFSESIEQYKRAMGVVSAGTNAELMNIILQDEIAYGYAEKLYGRIMQITDCDESEESDEEEN